MNPIDPSPRPVTGTYRIDPERSMVRFRTRAIFGLLPVRGALRIGEGEIRVADPPERSRVRAALRADSFDTGNQERDQHVRSADLLDAETHPELIFESDRLQLRPDGAAAVGRLVVRGITQPATLTLDQVEVREAGALAVRASTRVDRYAFGVTRYKGTAGRRLHVVVEVLAEPGPPA